MKCILGTLISCVVLLSACGTSNSTSGSDETEPGFDQVLAIAKQQMSGSPCQFQVKDDSDESMENKTLGCLTSAVTGEKQLYDVFQYTRDLEVSEYDFGGFTTADHYFQNGNITVNPFGGNPAAVQLNAEKFSTAVKDDCECGEVLTPK